MKFGQRWYDLYWDSWTQQDTLDSPRDPSIGNRCAVAAADPISGSDASGTITDSAAFSLAAARGRNESWKAARTLTFVPF